MSGQRGKMWRDIVQSSLSINDRLKKNMLEISLDKEQVNDVIQEEAIAKLFQNLGIRNEQIEGVQIIPQNHRGKSLFGSKLEST